MDYPLRLADQLRAHLRALRKHHGLTQAQLGQRLGVGQVRIAEIEANPGLVSFDQLISLLSALGVTLVLRDTTGADSSAPPRAAHRKVAKIRKAPAPPDVQPAGLRIPPKKGSW